MTGLSKNWVGWGLQLVQLLIGWGDELVEATSLELRHGCQNALIELWSPEGCSCRGGLFLAVPWLCKPPLGWQQSS